MPCAHYVLCLGACAHACRVLALSMEEITLKYAPKNLLHGWDERPWWRGVGGRKEGVGGYEKYVE